MVDTDTVHQKLMDESYKLWKVDQNIDYQDFLTKVREELDETHFFAVITGNLNSQVKNGGFSQWNDNGYSIAIEDIIDFFRKENRFDKKYEDVIHKVLRILRNVMDELDYLDIGKEEIKKINYDYHEIFERALEETSNHELRNLDKRFYEVHHEMLKALEEYFIKTTENKEG